jgi:protein-S-isoprenylcysteine O-methyltransferase Ste14
MSDQDLIFRAVVVLLFIGVRFVRWRTRRLVGWKVSWPTMKKRPLDAVVLLSLAVAWVTAVVVYAAVPGVVARFSAPIPVAVRWCAVSMAVAGLALLWWSDRCLGRNLSVVLKIRARHTLVTSGPYHWVRHPIYFATLLYAVAWAVITANYVLAIVIIAPMALLVALRLRPEEQMMIDKFGDEYRTYMQNTGRLLPKWRRS